MYLRLLPATFHYMMYFLKRFFTSVPIVFPLIALFHLGLTVYEAINYIGDFSVSYYYWLRPVVLAAYAVFWIGCCFRKRWGGLGYLILTILNVAFYFFGPEILLNLDRTRAWYSLQVQLALLKRAIGDILFLPLPANILFSFIILFYYQKIFPVYAKAKNALPGPEK